MVAKSYPWAETVHRGGGGQLVTATTHYYIYFQLPTGLSSNTIREQRNYTINRCLRRRTGRGGYSWSAGALTTRITVRGPTQTLDWAICTHSPLWVVLLNDAGLLLTLIAMDRRLRRVYNRTCYVCARGKSRWCAREATRVTASTRINSCCTARFHKV